MFFDIVQVAKMFELFCVLPIFVVVPSMSHFCPKIAENFDQQCIISSQVVCLFKKSNSAVFLVNILDFVEERMAHVKMSCPARARESSLCLW